MSANKLAAEDIQDIQSMRRRLGLDQDDQSRDDEIIAMAPFDRVKLLAGWHYGSENMADEWKSLFESQGLYLTTNPEGDDVLHYHYS